jgi:two-component system response regulator HupR/HoxA
MDQLGTVLILAHDAAEWADTVDLLSNQSGYRVLAVRSAGDANSALADAHVDLVIAEDGGSGDGLAFLSELRISHPEIIRLLALNAETSLAGPAVTPAAVYQFVRKPLDEEQVGLVVKRALRKTC